jgi:mannose-6-phosphate isomerase-like protein (cupin superfamily)
MKFKKYNLRKIARDLKKPWSPVEVASVDDYVLKIAIFDGEYSWHAHKDHDELFLVHEGSIMIETDEGSRELNAGDVTVIPKGLRHRPSAHKQAVIIMFESKDLVSAGD